MSSIEILKNFYDYGTSGISNIDNLSTIPLTFTKWSKEKLIYCNHPEQIKAGDYGEDGKFLNRVIVEANKKTMLYASYDHIYSKSLENIFAIRVFNSSSITANVTISKLGFASSDSADLACNAWKQYNQSSASTPISVTPKQSKWLLVKNTPMDYIELLALIETNVEIVVAVYACKDPSKILSQTGEIGKGKYTYSGWSDNYSLHTQQTLNASTLLASNKHSFFYRLGSPCNNNKNVNESIPINLVQGGIASFENGDNIGNYGIIYNFAMTIKNDTNKTVKFRGYVISNNKSLCAGIQSGSNVDGYFLGHEGAGKGKNKMRWHFYESRALKPGELLMPEFNYSILSKGSGACALQFEVVEV